MSKRNRRKYCKWCKIKTRHNANWECINCKVRNNANKEKEDMGYP